MDKIFIQEQLIGNIINKGSKKNAQVQKAFKSIKHTAFENYELRELYKRILEIDGDDINLITVSDGFNPKIFTLAEIFHQRLTLMRRCGSKTCKSVS